MDHNKFYLLDSGLDISTPSTKIPILPKFSSYSLFEKVLGLSGNFLKIGLGKEFYFMTL
jgi:hypothetical protein